MMFGVIGCSDVSILTNIRKQETIILEWLKKNEINFEQNCMAFGCGQLEI